MKPTKLEIIKFIYKLCGDRRLMYAVEYTYNAMKEIEAAQKAVGEPMVSIAKENKND